MRKSSGGKHMSQRALLKARVREVSEKFGKSFLSVLLAASLVPTAGVAYALDEGEDSTPIESPAPAESDPVDEPAANEAVAEPEAEPVQDPASQATSDEATDEPATSTDATPGIVEEVAETVETAGNASPKKLAAPKLMLKAANESSVNATVTVSGTPKEGKIYSNGDPVTATLTISGEGLEPADIVNIETPDGVTADTTWAVFSTALTVTKSSDLSGIKVTYKYTEEKPDPEDPEKTITEEKQNTVETTAVATPVVFDSQKPTIEAQLVTAKDSDTLAQKYAGTEDNYNLESNDLYVKVIAKDNEAIDTNVKSTVTWSFDSTGTGTLPETKEITLEKKSDGEYVGYAGPYTKDSFVVNGDLVVGTLTMTTKDLAGNALETEPAPVRFTSESALLLKVVESAKMENVSVAPAGSVKSATRDGKTVYNGDVTITLSNIDENLTLVAKDNGTELTGSSPFTIAAGEAKKNVSHDVTLEFTAKTDRATNRATKTVTLSGNDLSFYIDTTKPKLTATLSDPTTGTDPAFYGKDNAPKVTVSADNDSTLKSDNPYTYTIVDADGAETPLAVADNGTFEVPKQAKVYSIKVAANTIFGETLSESAAQTGKFVVDNQGPTIKVIFSGPGVFVDDAETIVGFFKATEETEGFKAGDVGKLTITVEDETLDSIKVEGVNGLTDVPSDQIADGKYSIVIPYIQEDDGTIYLGEGNDKTITVNATDKAENKSEYTYTSDPDKTGLPVEKKDAKSTEFGDKFTIDTTPVQFVKYEIADADYTEGNLKVYDAASVDMKVYVSDANFDPDASDVYVGSSESDKGVAQNVQWVEDGATYVATVTINNACGTDGSRVYNYVSLVANDRLGNETLERDIADIYGVIVLDNLAPDVDIALEPSPSGKNDTTDFYNKPVTATITIKDPFFDKAAVAVTKNGEVQSVSWDNPTEGVYVGTVKYPDQNAYGTVNTLSVKANDLVNSTGHVTEKSYGDFSPNSLDQFFIDMDAPKVSVKIDQKMVGNLSGVDYYASKTEGKLVATITATDAWFDMENSRITVAEESTGVASGWTDNSDGTWKATVTFTETPADVTESFSLSATDFAKNVTEYTYGDNNLEKNILTVDSGGQAVNPEKKAFVLDSTTPELVSVEFSESPVGTSVDDNNAPVADYYAAAPKATITVKDNNFESDTDLSKITPAGGKVTKSWEQQGGKGSDTWVAEVTFGENREGDYKDDWTSTLNFVFQDKVLTASPDIEGHDGSWSYATGTRKDQKTSGAPNFVVDLTQPTVKVSISEKAANNFDNKDFYGTVNGDGYLVATITVVDNNFDINSAITPANAAKTDTWSTNDYKTYTAKVYYEESKGIESPSDLALDVFDMVYTVATDKGTVEGAHRNGLDYRDANTEVQGAEGNATGFIIDLTAPVIDSVVVNQSPTSTGAGNELGDPIQFFNVATTMTFSIKDTNGLKEVSLNDPEGQYTVSAEGTNVKQGDTKGAFSIELVDGTQSSNDTEYERDIELRATDLSGNSRVWTIDRTGKVTSMRSESAANRSINDAGVYPVALIKDVTAPVVNLSGVTAGIFTNQTQTATATVTEFNFNYLQRFDSGRTIVRITKQEGNAGRAQSTVEVPAAAFTGSGSSWSNTQTFSTDGHYTLEASFRDYANNQSNVATIGEFTIDKTAPVIDSIVFDNNNVRNGRYYNAGRTATITITEHNWDDSLAVITSNGAISGWSTNGDTHVATVSFLTDGDYNLSVSVTDKAGNSAEQKAEDFTVDLTAPKIEFANVEEGTAYNDVIAPSIIYTDEKNFDASGIDYTIAGSKHGTQYASQLGTSRSDSGNSATVTFADFIREVEYDDIYTINAHMTDLAGNEAEGAITFSVNRFGSNFVILNAQELEGSRKNGYLADPVEVLIEEINVSGADSEQHGVSVTHGLDTENLELLNRSTPNSTGYYIETVNDSANWAHYTYHVYKPNFDVDGNYHVVVSSNDHATNKNNSASYYNPDEHAVADAEVSFILDTTDPIIDGLNVTPSSKENASSFDVTFTVTDNIAVDTVEVTLDGETQEVEPDLTGLCTVSVPAKSFTRRSISILATDLAGRTATAASEGFRVTTNFVENYWPGLVAAGVAGAGGGWWFLAGKRRKDEEEEEVA